MVYDPRKLLADKEYAGLSLSDRGLLRDIMDHVWCSQWRYFCDCGLTALAPALSEYERTLAIDLLARLASDTSLVRRQWNVAAEGEVYFFPMLRRSDDAARQRKRHAGRASKLDYIAERVRLSADGGAVATQVKNLNPGALSAEYFDGWFPTNRFSECGQAYFPEASYLTHLASEFDNVVVRDELVRMWGWLKSHPEHRPTTASFQDYLYRWMGRASVRNAQSSRSVAGKIDRDGEVSDLRQRLSGFFEGLIDRMEVVHGE